MNTKQAATILGIVFIAIGVLGFFPNPLVSPTGLFQTNAMHNLVHLISGAFLLAGVYTALGSGMALKILGVVYGLIAVLGLVMGPGMLLGMIHINVADNWLHVGLSAVILIAGFMLPDDITV